MSSHRMLCPMTLPRKNFNKQKKIKNKSKETLRSIRRRLRTAVKYAKKWTLNSKISSKSYKRYLRLFKMTKTCQYRQVWMIQTEWTFSQQFWIRIWTLSLDGSWLRKEKSFEVVVAVTLLILSTTLIKVILCPLVLLMALQNLGYICNRIIATEMWEQLMKVSQQ